MSKAFGANQALTGVDFEVDAGEVVALVGDNGAGKSTLIKAIAGVQLCDEGEFYFQGKPVKITSPQDATALGIATVYQDLALCDNLDVVANLYLGREVFAKGVARAAYFIDETAMEQSALELLDSLAVTTIKDVRVQVGLALRRAAAGGGHRALAARRAERGAARRADGRARRLADRTGAPAHQHACASVGSASWSSATTSRTSSRSPTASSCCGWAGEPPSFDVRGVSREDVVSAITGAEFGVGAESPGRCDA